MHKKYCPEGTPSKCVYHISVRLCAFFIRVRVTFRCIALFAFDECMLLGLLCFESADLRMKHLAHLKHSAIKLEQSVPCIEKLIKSLILILLFTLKPRGISLDDLNMHRWATYECASVLFNVQLLLRFFLSGDHTLRFKLNKKVITCSWSMQTY